MSARTGLIPAVHAAPQVSARAASAAREPALRLFWFHHAGGSARNYQAWRPLLPPDWDPVFLDYPGHGAKSHHPPERNMVTIAQVMLDTIAPLIDRPYAMFGHSMGSLAALEVARLAARRGLRSPVWLGVSGRRAPHRVSRSLYQLHGLSDLALIAALRDMGGMPPGQVESLNSVEYLRFLHTLRADLEACETYQVQAIQHLTCPITAFHGTRDATVICEEAEAWGELSSGVFRLRCFDGGHFYLAGRRGEVATAIVADVRQTLRHVAPLFSFSKRSPSP